MSVELFINPHFQRDKAYGAKEKAILSMAAGEEARATIAQWPGYRPTPLRSLSALAQETGVAAIDYKDEDARFVTKSFKALGGAFAYLELPQEGGPPDPVAPDGRPGPPLAADGPRVWFRDRGSLVLFGRGIRASCLGKDLRGQKREGCRCHSALF